MDSSQSVVIARLLAKTANVHNQGRALLLREPLSIGLLGAMTLGPSFYALAGSAETGRSNSGLKNRLPRAAKMIGVKPITAA